MDDRVEYDGEEHLFAHRGGLVRNDGVVRKGAMRQRASGTLSLRLTMGPRPSSSALKLYHNSRRQSIYLDTLKGALVPRFFS